MHRLPEILRGQRLLSACFLAAGLGIAGQGLAEPSEPPSADALRLSGFGTVGVSRTSAPPGWGFQREGLQPRNDGGTRFDTDSRLGLQANYAIDPRFELVGQLLLTRRFSDAAPGDTVAWAFAAYRPTENLTMRAGRISADLYLLSDYRSVGLAYPFVRPPTEFYSLLPSGFDGLDATQSWRDGADAIWKLTGFLGKGKQADNRSGTFRTIRPFYGMVVSREEQGLLVRGSVARSRLASDTPALAPLIAALEPLTGVPVAGVAADAATLQRQLTLKGQTVDYLTLGLNFDRDDWLWMLEASRANLRGVKRLDAGYALLGHRFGRITPYLALSAIRIRAGGNSPQWAAPLTPVLGPAGAAQAQALGELAYSAAMLGPAQRTLSAGMRWDVAPQTALKFQYDHTRIGARGSLLWANGTDEPAAAHVFSATLDFIF